MAALLWEKYRPASRRLKRLVCKGNVSGTGGRPALQAELDDFSNPLHQGVEVLRLGMTTAQSGNGSYVESVFVPLDETVNLRDSFTARF